MSTIHLHQTTTSTPEQYVAGLTDFGPGRSKLFGNSADDYRHRRSRRTRRQEHHWVGARLRARDHRQGRFEKGV